MNRTIPCLLLAAALATLPGFARAESFYVIDQIVVALRTEPSPGAESLTSLRTGTRVELLENLGSFMKVRTENGDVGFMPAQYLTPDKPGSLMLEELRKENDRLNTRLADLERGKPAATSKASSTETDQSLAAELTRTREKLKSAEDRFATLEKNAQEVVQIMNDRQRLQHENESLSTELEQLKEENGSMLRTEMIKWFVAGAGVFFFGWVIGKLSRKKRRGY